MTEADSFSEEPIRIKQIKKDRFSILIDGKAIFFRQRSFWSPFYVCFFADLARRQKTVKLLS